MTPQTKGQESCSWPWALLAPTEEMGLVGPRLRYTRLWKLDVALAQGWAAGLSCVPFFAIGRIVEFTSCNDMSLPTTIKGSEKIVPPSGRSVIMPREWEE